MISKVQILDRISLQYAPNANERTLHTNDTKNARYTKRTHNTPTNGMKPANYTENANERTHDTRTNESLERNHILSNDK